MFASVCSYVHVFVICVTTFEDLLVVVRVCIRPRESDSTTERESFKQIGELHFRAGLLALLSLARPVVQGTLSGIEHMIIYIRT